MANIHDYLKWRGDILVSKEYPINEVDSMILARVSYLIFNKIEMKSVETIKSVSSKMKKFSNEEFRYNGDKKLIELLGKSDRFKDMKLTNYEVNNEKKAEKQFGGITIHVNEEEMYVSYIGTDASIYGWKEDFNLAFMENIASQLEGVKYLENVSKEYPTKKIRIGGHSKGGNVAIYSGISVSHLVQDRIIKIYNYDGPGFNKKIVEKYKDKSIMGKITSYFPQESIIGRVLNHVEECKVVLSTEKGIYQHDIFSWQVEGKNQVYSKFTNSSEVMKNTVTKWLENTTEEQRKIFFDEVFELFYSTDAKTFGEISENLTKNIPVILKKYGTISPEDKKLITQMLSSFLKTYFKEYFGKEKNKDKLVFKEKVKEEKSIDEKRKL